MGLQIGLTGWLTVGLVVFRSEVSSRDWCTGLCDVRLQKAGRIMCVKLLPQIVECSVAEKKEGTMGRRCTSTSTSTSRPVTGLGAQHRGMQSKMLLLVLGWVWIVVLFWGRERDGEGEWDRADRRGRGGSPSYFTQGPYLYMVGPEGPP